MSGRHRHQAHGDSRDVVQNVPGVTVTKQLWTYGSSLPRGVTVHGHMEERQLQFSKGVTVNKIGDMLIYIYEYLTVNVNMVLYPLLHFRGDLP